MRNIISDRKNVIKYATVLFAMLFVIIVMLIKSDNKMEADAKEVINNVVTDTSADHIESNFENTTEIEETHNSIDTNSGSVINADVIDNIKSNILLAVKNTYEVIKQVDYTEDSNTNIGSSENAEEYTNMVSSLPTGDHLTSFSGTFNGPSGLELITIFR